MLFNLGRWKLHSSSLRSRQRFRGRQNRCSDGGYMGNRLVCRNDRCWSRRRVDGDGKTLCSGVCFDNTFFVVWKMCVITIYEDEREMIVTCVSKCGIQCNQRRQVKAERSSQIIETSFRHHMCIDKTIQTRTFLDGAD